MHRSLFSFISTSGNVLWSEKLHACKEQIHYYDFFVGGGGVVWRHVDYLCIIVMFLSAVWTLILTAPIHCRGSNFWVDYSFKPRVSKLGTCQMQWLQHLYCWWIAWNELYFFQLHAQIATVFYNCDRIFKILIKFTAIYKLNKNIK